MQASFPSAHEAPALTAHHRGFSLLTEDGEFLTLSASELRARLDTMPCPLVVCPIHCAQAGSAASGPTVPLAGSS